jgi:serine/threonine-protein kinase HipA
MSVENEHLCMQFTAALGLSTAKTNMMELGGKRVLVVERFDRLWTGDGRLLRLPQEDCCQALSVPPTLKYEAGGGPGIGDILILLKGSDDPEYDQKTFMKAVIVFWLMGATDGHAKNFSIYLGSWGRFHMTPLYNVMSAQPYFDTGQITWNKVKLALSVGKRRHCTINTIVPRHFIETVEDSGMPARNVQTLLEELLVKTPDAIDIVLKNLPPDFPEEIAGSISEGMMHRLGKIRHSI